MGHYGQRFLPARALRSIGGIGDDRLESFSRLAMLTIGGEGGYLALSGDSGWRIVSSCGLPESRSKSEFPLTLKDDVVPYAVSDAEKVTLWPFLGAFETLFVAPVVLQGETIGHLGSVSQTPLDACPYRIEALRVLAKATGDYLEAQARIRELLGELWDL